MASRSGGATSIPCSSREHWNHLRITNPVESPFVAVRLRSDAGKRYKKVANATPLIWRLLLVDELSFLRLDRPELLPEVVLGTRYRDGIRIVDQAAPPIRRPPPEAR